MTYDELDVYDTYYFETAVKELEKAEKSQEQGFRAKGQEQLRECMGFYQKLPKTFEDESFSQRYDRCYNLLYRGYA